MLAGATRLWFAVDAGRNRSMRLIVVALVGVLVSDTAYSVESIQGTWVDGTVWDLGWFAFYIGLGAAALHPSVAALPVVRHPERAITRWRFILLLSLMSMLPLILVLGEADLTSTAQGLVILVGALVMFGLVLFGSTTSFCSYERPYAVSACCVTPTNNSPQQQTPRAFVHPPSTPPPNSWLVVRHGSSAYVVQGATPLCRPLPRTTMAKC